jgi:hypothetical protein
MIDDVFADDRADRDGGANGSIIGFNTCRLRKVRALIAVLLPAMEYRILTKRRGRGEDQGG